MVIIIFVSSAEYAKRPYLFNCLENIYSDANDLENIYGRYTPLYTKKIIDNMPIDEDGFMFSYSNNLDRKVQFFYTYNQLYERSKYTDTWSNWRKIYPDYTTKLIQDNGYIVLNNELIFQWRHIWFDFGNSGTWVAKNVVPQLTGLTTFVLLGTVSWPMNYSTFYSIELESYSDIWNVRVYNMTKPDGATTTQQLIYLFWAGCN